MKIEIIVAVNENKDKLLMKTPEIMKKYYVDGIFVEEQLWLDEDFLNLIPDNIGIYKCICESELEDDKYKDDINKFYEDTRQGYLFKILSVEELYLC